MKSLKLADLKRLHVFRSVFVAGMALLLSDFVFGESSSDQLYYICKNGKNVRSVRVFRPEGSLEWKVTYTKSGIDTPVGAGKSFSFCKSMAENIRVNLEKTRWQCKDRSETQVSTDTPSAGDRPAEVQ